MWIEIFKAGRHTSSNGSEINFTVEDLDKISNQYNARNSEDTSLLAPLVKGHPKNDTPAYGWVERLARRGNYLLAKLRDLTPEIIDEVRSKKFQKISISLTRDLQLKHIGLLGAASPAVEGLTPIAFSELDENIDFEYLHNDESIAQLVHQNNELKEKVLNYERTLISRDLLDFTSNLIAKNIIPSSQKQSAFEIFELAHEIDRTSSLEYNLLDKLKKFFNKLQYQSLNKEFATNNNSKLLGEFSNNRDILANREKLHNTIIEFMQQNPEMNYQQALNFIIENK